MWIKQQFVFCLLMSSINLISGGILNCPAYSKPNVNGNGIAETFLALNAKLVPSVPNQDTRLGKLPASLLSVDADVVCINQIFHEDDIQSVTNAVVAKYPNVYSSIHGLNNNLLPAGKSPCSGWRTFWKLLCLSRRCSDQTDIEYILDCGIEKCSAWSALSQECLTCVGTAGPANALAKCVFSAKNINVAGNMILSKAPIENAESSFYVTEKQANRRGKLIVEIAGRTIACTNMQQASNDIYYEPDTQYFGSFANENLEQAKCINSEFQQQSQVILMGDLECGPAIPSAMPSIRGEHEPSYDELTTQFSSPYVNLGITTSTRSNIISTHVMQKGYTGQDNCSQVLGYYDGVEISTQYGVKCTIPS